MRYVAQYTRLCMNNPLKNSNETTFNMAFMCESPGNAGIDVQPKCDGSAIQLHKTYIKFVSIAKALLCGST